MKNRIALIALLVSLHGLGQTSSNYEDENLTPEQKKNRQMFDACENGDAKACKKATALLIANKLETDAAAMAKIGCVYGDESLCKIASQLNKEIQDRDSKVAAERQIATEKEEKAYRRNQDRLNGFGDAALLSVGRGPGQNRQPQNSLPLQCGGKFKPFANIGCEIVACRDQSWVEECH